MSVSVSASYLSYVSMHSSTTSSPIKANCWTLDERQKKSFFEHKHFLCQINEPKLDVKMLNYYDECFIAIIQRGIRTMLNQGTHTQCRVVRESNWCNSLNRNENTNFNAGFITYCSGGGGDSVSLRE